MRVRVRFLSLMREYAGSDSVVLEVDGESIRVSELVEKLLERMPRLREAFRLLGERGMKPLVMVNGVYADEDTVVEDGAEVALLPPAAGGGVRAGLVEEPVSIDRIAAEIASRASREGAGALVVFMGFVKGVVGGGRVEKLVYEAYEPYASRILEEIANRYAGDPEVTDIIVYHRVGELEPGEPTIYVFVAAKNRHKAFSVAAQVLEEVKHRAPIYKLERRDDGDYWVVGDGTRIPRSERREGGGEREVR